MVGNFLVLGSVSEWKHAGMKLLKLLSQWLEELLRINFRKLRQTIEADAAARAVAKLATVSPAWFKDRAHIRSPHCLWCSETLAHGHICAGSVLRVH